jgi:2-oxo-4-hydroxy-4-carboxy-5-ureidoimidazoline decarboxylase
MTLEELNRADPAAFVAALGAIYEHSPWVAEAAAASRPFATGAALHAAMAAAVARSPHDRRLALVAGHPDLGGRLARAGELEPASAEEQAGLGLDRLSDEEFDRFEALNGSYREKFGFPFVIAAKRHTRASVLAAFETRLRNDAASELATALAEIDEIARLRLQALLDGDRSWT